MSWLKDLVTTKNVTEEKVHGKTKEEVANAPEDKFQKWYNSLSEKEKKKFDKKALKYRLKYGTAVMCIKCGKPGGTLRKIKKDTYVHEVCPRRT